MKTTKLNSGIEMPMLGLGTWLGKTGEIEAAVEHALKVGYRHIDCASIYGNESEVGTGIEAAIAKGYITREQLFVTSKLWMSEYYPAKVRPALQKTLKELKLTYLDHYMLHWPVAFNAAGEQDAAHDVSKTYKILEECMKEGMVKSLGVCNFSEDALMKLLANCSVTPSVNQIECHPHFQQKKLREFMKSKGIAVEAYCPLGIKGVVSASSAPAVKNPVIVEIATAKGRTPAQVTLRWGLQVGNSVIPKSVTPSRIEENSKLFDFELTSEEMGRIAAITTNTRNVNPDFGPGKTPFFAE